MGYMSLARRKKKVNVARYMMSVKRKKIGSSGKQGQARSTGIPPEAIERAVHELPVYTREELEAKLKWLEGLIIGIRSHAENVIIELGAILNRIRGVTHHFLPTDLSEEVQGKIFKLKGLIEEVREKMFELDEFIRSLAKRVVIRALNLDDNFEKWERVFGVTFKAYYGSPLIGLAVVREESGEHVPVVVRIAYGGELEFVPVEEYK
jgi:hypothetical protein